MIPEYVQPQTAAPSGRLYVYEKTDVPCGGALIAFYERLTDLVLCYHAEVSLLEDMFSETVFMVTWWREETDAEEQARKQRSANARTAARIGAKRRKRRKQLTEKQK